MSLGKSCVFTHPVEDGLFVGKQVLGRVEFNLFAVGQDEDLGVVHDGVEPVRDGQHGAVEELGPDGRLDEVVSLKVDRGRGLVEDQNLGLSQQGSGQAHELPLAHTVGKQ